MDNYNGKKEPTLRIYDSIRNFVGENKVHKCGDVLCVSMQNNENYDRFLIADGKSDFRTLFENGTGQKIVVTEEGDTLRIKVV